MLKNVPVWTIYHVATYLSNTILSIGHKVLTRCRLTIEKVTLKKIPVLQREISWRLNNVLRAPGPGVPAFKPGLLPLGLCIPAPLLGLW